MDDTARAALALPRLTGSAKPSNTRPIADNYRLCAPFSLALVCLPEEVRQEQQPERVPLRLFPPDRDETTLYVVSLAASIRSCSTASRSFPPRSFTVCPPALQYSRNEARRVGPTIGRI